MLRQIGCFLPLVVVVSGVFLGGNRSEPPRAIDCSLTTQFYSDAPLDQSELAHITPENAGQLVQIGQIGRGPISAVALSPDEKTLAVATTMGIWLYLLDGQNTAPRFLCGHTGIVRSVAFSEDGYILGSGSDDQTVRLWDVETGAEIAVLGGDGGAVGPIVFNTLQNVIVTGNGDQTVRIWDLSTNTELHRLDSAVKGVAGSIVSLAVSPNGEELLFSSASGGGDYAYRRTIQTWSFSQKRLIDDPALKDRSGVIKFSPDGTKIALLEVNVTLLDAATKEVIAEVVQPQQAGTRGWIVDMLWRADSTALLLTILQNDDDYREYMLLEQYEMASQELKTLIEPTHNSISLLAEHKDRLLLTSTSTKINYEVQTWQMTQDATFELQDTLSQMENHNSSAMQISISPDNTLIAVGGYSENIAVYDLSTLEQRFILSGHSIWVRDIVFSQDSTLIATVDTHAQLRLWDAHSGELHQTRVILPNSNGWGVAFSLDGSLVAASAGYGPDDSIIRVWDVATGEEKISFPGFTNAPIEFNADGTHLLARAWGETQVWDISTGKQADSIKRAEGTPPIAVSPEGRILASIDQFDIVLWDSDSQIELTRLKNHLGRGQELTFSSDGKLIATGGDDSVIRLWGVLP